jgi:hypothetical protein
LNGNGKEKSKINKYEKGKEVTTTATTTGTTTTTALTNSNSTAFLFITLLIFFSWRNSRNTIRYTRDKCCSKGERISLSNVLKCNKKRLGGREHINVKGREEEKKKKGNTQQRVEIVCLGRHVALDVKGKME